MQVEIRNPSADWTPYAPNGDHQKSLDETNACSSFSIIHSLESQYFLLTGKRIDWSERALAVISDNSSVSGNSAQEVWYTLDQLGLLTIQDWPEIEPFTLAEFYAPIPQATRNRGYIFKRQWKVQYEEIHASDAERYLQSCPLVVRMKLPDTFHFVELLNTHTYFDSYEQYIKELNYPIVNYYALYLTPKKMTNAKLISVNGTLGYWYPVTTPDGLKSQALNVGEVLPEKGDGTVDFSRVTPDFTI